MHMMTAGPSVAICGVPISRVPLEEVLERMDQAIKSRQNGGYISITNTESMYHALRSPEHLQYVRGADLSLCDGVGVVAAAAVWGHRVSRLNGPILQLECCRHGVANGWRHFFYGGNEGVADQMVANLKQLFPGMISVGTYYPPFRTLTADEDKDIVRVINEAKPDIVWVGLGLLKQERWIAQHLDSVRAPWMVGVGAAFDYHSGAVPWAPKWVRRIGCEWLFRLIIQPKLRAKRYWWSLLFVIEAILRRFGIGGRQWVDQ